MGSFGGLMRAPPEEQERVGSSKLLFQVVDVIRQHHVLLHFLTLISITWLRHSVHALNRTERGAKWKKTTQQERMSAQAVKAWVILLFRGVVSLPVSNSCKHELVVWRSRTAAELHCSDLLQRFVGSSVLVPVCYFFTAERCYKYLTPVVDVVLTCAHRKETYFIFLAEAYERKLISKSERKLCPCRSLLYLYIWTEVASRRDEALCDLPIITENGHLDGAL